MASETKANSSVLNNIVFFDGVCGMCNRLVDFLIKIDKQNRLLYAPLQGETAKKLLTKEQTIQLNTFVFYQDGKHFERSDAGIRTLRTIGGFWAMAVLLQIWPRFIRNPIYNFIAKRRYHWFGKKEACRLPTPEERSKFLD